MWSYLITGFVAFDIQCSWLLNRTGKGNALACIWDIESCHINSRRKQMEVSGLFVRQVLGGRIFQRTSWTWCRAWLNHSWYSHLKSTLFCIHSFAHLSDANISCHSRIQSLQRCFVVASHRDQLIGIHLAAVDQLTVGQLLPLSDCMETGWTALRMKWQISDSGIWSRTNEHCRGSYNTPAIKSITHE